jgi:hypothetical protein
MTVSTMAIIMSRIASASPASPIAVFDVGRNDVADAMFASTAHVALRRRMRDHNLIGVFDKEMNPEWIKMAIYARLARN